MEKLTEIQKKVLASYKTWAPKGFPKKHLWVGEGVAWSDFETKTGRGSIFYKLPGTRSIVVATWQINTKGKVAFVQFLNDIPEKVAAAKLKVAA